MTKAQPQLFGGDWTEQKLDMLRKYLSAYTTTLKNQSFTLVYIDAFAGSGYRRMKDYSDGREPMLFEELAEDDAQSFLRQPGLRSLFCGSQSR